MEIDKYLEYGKELLMPAFLRPIALKRWFKRNTGRELHLNPPVTLCDKLNWIKLYGVTDEMTRLTDKYLVQDWIKKKIGEKYLIPLLGVYDRFKDIDFAALPSKFVLKTNHASDTNIIVRDKSRFDIKAAEKKVNRWMARDHSFVFGYQMQYHKIKRKIIIEEYIENSGHVLYDYKFHCFDGKPLCCGDIERGDGEVRQAFFDMEWNYLPYRTGTYPTFDELPPKPKNYEEMVEVATILCKGFPYVRVDLYHLDDGSIKFGEMTFTPSSGHFTWYPEGTDEELGKLVTLRSDGAY